MKWTRIVKELQKVAEAADGVKNRRLAAAIYHRGDLVSIGWNRLKTDTFQLRYGKNPQSIYLHAEIDAIKRAIRELSNSHYGAFTFPSQTTIVVVRWDSKTDSLRMAKPCVGCARAIRDYGISQIVYTTNDGTIAIEKA